MKKILFIVGGLFVATFSMAETIDAVTFNPSRLGRYEHLKISDKLDSPGGVYTQAMTVQSNGTVTLDNAGNYSITKASVEKADLSNTDFSASDMQVRGGKATFTDASADYLKSTLSTIRLKSNEFYNSNSTLSVRGGNQSDYDGNTIKGLKLGGNDIPLPSNCSGSMNWVERTDTSGKKHMVLSMTTCTPSKNEDNTTLCYGDTYYDEYSELCICNNEDAVWYQGECCSESNKDNRVCWSEPYEDENCTSIDLGYEFMYGNNYINKVSFAPDEGETCDVTDFGKGGQACTVCNASTEGKTCYEAGGVQEGSFWYCTLWQATCIHDYDEECVWEEYQDYLFPWGGSNYYDPDEYPNGY